MNGAMHDLFWLMVGLLGLLAAAAMAVPISVLVWWSGWTRRAHDGPGVSERPAQAAAPAPVPAGPILVYFSGVGDISDAYQSRYEDELLEAVAERVRGLVAITDVFGFSVDNLSMTSQRRLGWFWRWVHDVRTRKNSPLKRAGLLINLRNILHISVSADGRYGPVYNYGVAEMVLQLSLIHI